MKITAKDKHVFVRNHDNFRMSNEIHLGYDFSTGIKRQDKTEYYHEEPMTEEEIEMYNENKEGEIKNGKTDY